MREDGSIGFRALTQPLEEEWRGGGVSSQSGQFGSAALPAIPISDQLRVLPAIEEYTRLPANEWMPKGAYQITPSVAMQYDIPLGSGGLLQLGGGAQHQMSNMPMQRNRTDYFAGGNVSVPFESSGMIDAIRKYMRE